MGFIEIFYSKASHFFVKKTENGSKTSPSLQKKYNVGRIHDIEVLLFYELKDNQKSSKMY